MKKSLALLLALAILVEAKAQTITFSLRDFVLTDDPCILKHGSLKMELIKFSTPDELYCDSIPMQRFEVVQASISGPLVLPGDQILVRESIATNGYLSAILYSKNQKIKGQQINTSPFNSDSGPLLFGNNTDVMIDSLIIADVELGIYEGYDYKISITLNRPSLSHHIQGTNNGRILLGQNIFDQKEPKPFKVCTDGSDVSIFSITKEKSNLTNILWTLRIKEDPDGSKPDLYGFFEKAVGSATDTSLTFKYHHPNYLPAGGKDSINIEAYDQLNHRVIGELPLKLFRAPVLLVHGLWGSAGSFSAMEESLKNSPEYEGFQIMSCDYEDSNDESFSANQFVVGGCILGTLSKTGLLESVAAEKIAAGKVDVVAHSMGGLLARRYLQLAGSDNRIHKLITINTPHAGSQMANALFDQTLAPGNENACKYLDGFFAHAFGKGGSCYTGAVDNLRVDSPILKTLNSTAEAQAPSHAIATYIVYNGTKLEDDLGESLGDLAEKMNLTVPIILAIFNNQPNDGVVAMTSQTGGLLNAVSIFEDVNHLDVTERAGIIAKVKGLLAKSPNSSSFEMGFNPIPLQYGSNLTPTPIETAEDIAIKQPTAGKEFNVGETVTVAVEAANSAVVYMEVSLSDGAAPYLFGNFTEKVIQGTSGNVNFSVLKGGLGGRLLTVDGYNSAGERISEAHSYIVVNTTEAPTKIRVEPRGWHPPVGETERFRVQAYFEKYISEISGLPNVTYQFDNGKARHIGNGRIEALEVGRVEMTVSFNGVASEPVSITILPSDSMLLAPPKIGKVYPNPATDLLNIEAIFPDADHLHIRDILGRVFISQDIQSDHGFVEASVDISSLNKGIYLVTLTGGRSASTAKFIKL